MNATVETPPLEPDPPDLVEIGAYRTAREGFEHGLVVLSLGAPFWLQPAGADFRVMVEPSVAETAREQLAKFDRESASWPPPAFVPAAPRHAYDLASPLVWALLLGLCFWAQGIWPPVTDQGALEPLAVVRELQLWRVFTALFLHADVGHLISNAISGCFVFAAVLAAFGRARGWRLLTWAGVLGNAAAAVIRYPNPGGSIGASTAVFGAVGLLTGQALRAVWASPARTVRALLVPAGSGFVVLGLYGAGGVQIDVLAHATGFGTGVLLGLLARPVPERSLGSQRNERAAPTA